VDSEHDRPTAPLTLARCPAVLRDKAGSSETVADITRHAGRARRSALISPAMPKMERRPTPRPIPCSVISFPPQFGFQQTKEAAAIEGTVHEGSTRYCRAVQAANHSRDCHRPARQSHPTRLGRRWFLTPGRKSSGRDGRLWVRTAGWFVTRKAAPGRRLILPLREGPLSAACGTTRLRQAVAEILEHTGPDGHL